MKISKTLQNRIWLTRYTSDICYSLCLLLESVNRDVLLLILVPPSGWELRRGWGQATVTAGAGGVIDPLCKAHIQF